MTHECIAFQKFVPEILLMFLLLSLICHLIAVQLIQIEYHPLAFHLWREKIGFNFNSCIQRNNVLNSFQKKVILLTSLQIGPRPLVHQIKCK